MSKAKPTVQRRGQTQSACSSYKSDPADPSLKTDCRSGNLGIAAITVIPTKV